MEDAIRSAIRLLDGAIQHDRDRIKVVKPAVLTSAKMDDLVKFAVFGESEEERDAARWVIWELAQETGCGPASIHELYLARGRGDVASFTVPAMNLRVLAYHSARAAFRAALKRKAAALIFEIARSEIAYTEQRPAEYTAVILGAALREGFRSPVFVQGDHFQVSAAKYKTGPDKEVEAIRMLIDEGLAAGFFNIDIDTSTLVDLSFPTLDEQQRENYERAAELAAYVRLKEPKGVTVSIGGEIGEVGGKNSTVEELTAYMDGFNKSLKKRNKDTVGLSKISVQTGTSHGGVVLSDGSIASVKLDLAALDALSHAARKQYGMGGAVQHGASTLPEDAFTNFPKHGACEIHLATGFQNMVFDHPKIPAPLRARIRDWIVENCAAERKASDSEQQFIYKTRKKAIGPFKKEMWHMPDEVLGAISDDLEARFGFLFDQLGIAGSAESVAKYVKAPVMRHRGGAAAAPDDAEAGE